MEACRGLIDVALGEVPQEVTAGLAAPAGPFVGVTLAAVDPRGAHAGAYVEVDQAGTVRQHGLQVREVCPWEGIEVHWARRAPCRPQGGEEREGALKAVSVQPTLLMSRYSRLGQFSARAWRRDP
jgi:hypothetical protein